MPPYIITVAGADCDYTALITSTPQRYALTVHVSARGPPVEGLIDHHFNDITARIADVLPAPEKHRFGAKALYTDPMLAVAVYNLDRERLCSRTLHDDITRALQPE